MRNVKVAKLAEIIGGFKPFPFYFSIDRRLFEDILKPVTAYGLKQPHYYACFAVIAGVVRHAAQSGITTPIEFIFDKQDGVDETVRLFFSEMLRKLPSEMRDLVSDAWFKDDRDKQFMPLQAADMLAWHVRRKHEFPEQSLPLLDDLLCCEEYLVGDIPDDVVRKWADHDSKQVGLAHLQTKLQ